MGGPEKDAHVDKQKTSGCRNFLNFLYNNEEGKVLGRTCTSWMGITVFYIIFYACLSGFFAGNLAIFMHTLDPKWPRYFGKGSIIGVNPGLGYQPWLKDNAESTLIRFQEGNYSSFKEYTDALDKFFLAYNVTKMDGLRYCHPGQGNKDEGAKKGCIFDRQVFEENGCGPPYYGFDKGHPCVVLTLNKLIAWEPVSFTEKSLPATLPPAVKKAYNGDVAVACEGEYFVDQENIGQLVYIPPSGINRTFFPYNKVMTTYHQPFAMVKFVGLKAGILVRVECKAYADNIVHDKANRLGMVHFEIFKRAAKKNLSSSSTLPPTDANTEIIEESSTDDLTT